MNTPLHEIAALLRHAHHRIAMMNVKDAELEFNLRHTNVKLLNTAVELERMACLIKLDEENRSENTDK